MGTSLVLKDLVAKTVQADFKNVYETLHNKELEVASATKFIVACCTACNNNLSKPSNIDEQSLSKLLKYLIKFIRDPTDKILKTYLQSLLFILKLLLEKKCFDVIIDMEHICIPTFMPDILIIEHRCIYQSICSCIFNTVVGLSHIKDLKYNQDLLKICYLLCSMYNRFLNQDNLIEKAYKCTVCLSALGISEDYQMNYYINLINMLKKPEKKDQDKSYKFLLDFFSHIMINLIKQNKCDQAAKCCEETVKKCEKLFGDNFNVLLEISLWLNPKYTKQMILINLHNKFKAFYKQNGLTMNLQTTCISILTITTAFVQYYKNTDSHVWTCKIINDQLHFYKLLFNISELYMRLPFKCCCNIKRNLIDSVRTIISIIKLSYLFIVEDHVIPDIYLFDLLKYFKESCNHIMILKNNYCHNWKNLWNEITIYLYNICICLYKKDNFNTITFLTLIVKYVIKLEGVQSNKTSQNILNFALSGICEINIKASNFKEALEMCAFNIAILPKSRETEFMRWIKCKINSKEYDLCENKDIQESTIVSILNNMKQLKINGIMDNFKLDKEEQTELLIFELESYKMKWKSKLPMMAAYRELIQITNSFESAEVFINIWGQCDLQVHDEIPKLLQKTLKLFESNLNECKTNENEINFAYLYYLYYKFSSKHAIRKNCENMEKTLNNLKSSNDDNIQVVDCDDECDIISSYEALKLDNCNKIIEYIEKSIAVLLHMIRNDTKFNKLDLKYQKRAYDLLMLIGYEFRLQMNIIYSMQAWELALHVAKLIQDPILILQSIGFIVEFSSLYKSDTKQLIEKGDEIVKDLRKDNKYSQFNILIIYLVCKIKVYFIHDFQMAYKDFNIALELLRCVEDVMEAKFLTAVLDCLHYKFQQFHCTFKIEGHETVTKIYEAYRNIVNQYTDNKCNCSYKISCLFEINEELIKMYHDRRMIREIRCYAKAMVLIAQSMILPIRIALLLKTLAYADLLGYRINDCKVKLNGLNDILCLEKRKYITPSKSSQETKLKTEINKIVDDLSYDFKEMMLDLSFKTFYHQSSPSSPLLVVENFKLPSLFNHLNHCHCFYCISIEYKKCILWKAYLDALLNQYKDQEIARHFFIGSIKIYELFKRKHETYEMKIHTFLSLDVLHDYMNNFFEIYCHILFSFANYMIRSNNAVHAENINNKAISCIYPRKLEFIFLYNQILLQKFCILETSRIRSFQNVVKQNIEIENVVNNTKTPETKQSHVSLPKQSYSKSPLLQVVKTLKFDLSDTEDDAEIKKPLVQNSMLPIFLDNVSVTPAPVLSKIKTYSKSASKKRSVLTNIPISSPNACSSNTVNGASKIDQGLMSKTKQLTEKFKQSSNKQLLDKPTSLVDHNNEDCSTDNICTIVTRTRKKILSDIDDSKEVMSQTRQIRRTRKKIS